MKRFTYKTRVSAPLEAVAAFHQDSQALRTLTPPPAFVQFHEVQPLKDGSVADFTLWFGPLPVRWVAVHSQVDHLNGFTDYQARGPFDSWVHKHSFYALDENNTLITDEIRASLKSNPFWWAFGELMWLSLPLLFVYRKWAVQRALHNPFNQISNPVNSYAGERHSN